MLLSFSFHLEVVIVSVCLAYLPSIYFGSLTRLLRPLRPRHLLRTCLAHIPHTHIPKTTYIYIMTMTIHHTLVAPHPKDDRRFHDGLEEPLDWGRLEG